LLPKRINVRKTCKTSSKHCYKSLADGRSGLLFSLPTLHFTLHAKDGILIGLTFSPTMDDKYDVVFNQYLNYKNRRMY